MMNFSCLLKTLEIGRKKAKIITLTCIELHNLLHDRFIHVHQGSGDRVDRKYRDTIPAAWRCRLTLFRDQHLPGRNYSSNEAKLTRDTLKHYLMSQADGMKCNQQVVLQDFENEDDDKYAAPQTKTFEPLSRRTIYPRTD